MTHSHYNKNMIDIENFSKSNKLFDGHYQLLRPLSTDGGTADVWLAIDVNTVDVSVEEDEKRLQVLRDIIAEVGYTKQDNEEVKRNVRRDLYNV